MRPVRVYADTSVFGGCFDAEFEQPSLKFFDMVRAGHYELVVSPLTAQELDAAPAAVQQLFREMLPLASIAPVSEEAENLQQAYLSAGIVGANAETDALHVAVATVSGCAIIVSWNFRHIVNYRRIAQYNLVNVQQGYAQIAIHSPAEVIEYEDQEEV